LTDLHSFFGNKKTLVCLRNLVNISHEISKWTIISVYAIENINGRLSTLEKIVEEIAQKMKIDLRNVKTEMENLKTAINSPPFTTVSNFVQDMDKALAKLDKNRKDILRDSVV
jgi:hypothetical protein